MNPIPMPRRRLWLALAAALSLPLSGCLDDHGHEHDEQGEHVDHGTVDEADHGDEPHMLSVTTWSSALELFMEYPEPVAGEPGKYITHLTWLEDFSPVVSGPLRYRFTREDGHVEEYVAETITRDGIFLPEIAVERPGHYHLELVLGRGDDHWTIGAGEIDVVAANGASYQHGEEPVPDGGHDSVEETHREAGGDHGHEHGDDAHVDDASHHDHEHVDEDHANDADRHGHEHGDENHANDADDHGHAHSDPAAVGRDDPHADSQDHATQDDHGHDHGPGAHEPGHDDSGDIAFLKEQQWRMDFAVQQVFTDYITEHLSVPARIEPRPGQSAKVTAPAGGRLLPPEDGAWTRPGEPVEAGDVLARVLPLSGAEDVSLLDLDLTQARERVSLARAERDRVQSLHGDGVVSEKRLEQATSEYRVARQALERARTRLEQLEDDRGQSRAAVALRAPISGVITASPLAPGELVATNQAVFSVLDDSRVWLKAMAYPGDMARIKGPGDLVARQAGGQWQSLPGAELAYTGTRTEENGTVPLVFDVPNPDGRLIPGTAWSAAFSTGAGQMAVVVPKSAILDDDGIEVVIVQHGGESFERRQVKTGIRSGDRVAITAGLHPGERVVTRGAYTVLLASRGEQDIGHGHAH